MKELTSRLISELSAFYQKREAESFVFMLVEKICGLNKTQQLIIDDFVPMPQQRLSIDDAINRLKRYEPIQHILGEIEFHGLCFRSDKRALVPRPETEELVAWIIEETASLGDAKILDIGTGGGCIAISLACRCDGSVVKAIDISSEAISLAKENALKNNVKIDFIEADIFNPPPRIVDYYDIIVSNPPYVIDSEKSDMKANVLDYEPHLALFVRDDEPLVFYEQIANFAFDNLCSGGYLFFEINRMFGTQMVEMLKKIGYHSIVLKKDISNNDRFVMCRKN